VNIGLWNCGAACSNPEPRCSTGCRALNVSLNLGHSQTNREEKSSKSDSADERDPCDADAVAEKENMGVRARVIKRAKIESDSTIARAMKGPVDALV
jgi:hypothetical protein